jgi:hypothetical protein
MDANVRQYLETALWSSTADNGDALDKNYSLEDVSEETFTKAAKDWQEFLVKCGDLLTDLDLSDVAHDFWLTRNRHGAGFWDGDYEKDIGEKLTEIAHSFGEIDLYVGDDNKIYS